MGRITFILGGARSGKSSFAQALAAGLVSDADGGKEKRRAEVTYLATATVGDEEMRQRVALHRQNRPRHWRTVEEPRHVGLALGKEEADVVIVDCLTLLITNIMLELGADRPDAAPAPARLEDTVMREIEQVLRQSRRIAAEVVLISNEVGMSVVPPTPLGRTFRDIAGRINQRVAREAESVYLLVAGLAQRLK